MVGHATGRRSARSCLSIDVSHAREVAAGDRFEFGRNWSRFLLRLTPKRIQQAEHALREALQVDTLAGKRFFDLGSGSGLSSLAARNLGASVVSVDFDPHSVACTAELKRRYWNGDRQWQIFEGSALDRTFLTTLGRHDIVYSWGVLHHTGMMWQALANVIPCVQDGGTLFLSIYNDQGKTSVRWRKLKKFYNKLPRTLQGPFACACFAKMYWRPLVKDMLQGRPFHTWRTHGTERGMSLWTDLIDWIGGYPFEVAKPEEIFRFYREHGFSLQELRTQGGSLGCNEFVFVKTDVPRLPVA